ncbi:hypothetical protein [Methanobrevibacter filiformis]|nr:hypothetical protein [Methanobrevibacter filiformis]
MATFHITFPKTYGKIVELRKKFYTPYEYKKEVLSHKIWKKIMYGIFVTEITREDFKTEQIEVWKNDTIKKKICLQYGDIVKYFMDLTENSDSENGITALVDFQEFMKSTDDLVEILEKELNS